jgi:hypothetical protein
MAIMMARDQVGLHPSNRNKSEADPDGVLDFSHGGWINYTEPLHKVRLIYGTDLIQMDSRRQH